MISYTVNTVIDVIRPLSYFIFQFILLWAYLLTNLLYCFCQGWLVFPSLLRWVHVFLGVLIGNIVSSSCFPCLFVITLSFWWIVVLVSDISILKHNHLRGARKQFCFCHIYLFYVFFSYLVLHIDQYNPTSWVPALLINP